MTLHSLRKVLKDVLRRFNLLTTARWFWYRINPTLRRREKRRREEFLRFKQQYGDVLRYRLNNGENQKKALVVSIGFIDGVRTELGLIKGLELAGFTPVVLSHRNPWLIRYYKLAGVEEFLFWDEFADSIDTAAAEATVDRWHSFDDILAFEYEGARVGRCAASTLLRHLRVGSLDLQAPEIRESLAGYIASGMAYATATQAIIREVQPQLAMFVDRGYSPQGELFDICLREAVDTITWNAAHRSNALMLKRYTLDTRDEHPASLSEESWRQLRTMRWGEEHRERLRQELYTTYASGDWYSEVGTQFNKHIVEPNEIQQRLGLDPKKKTAVIFPHIVWDGTFFWGQDLFDNYEEWFIETVRVACTNNQVNWIIKIHPANIVKNIRDGVQGEPSEIVALRKHIGQLPSHLFIISADSDINTFSLYELMDYCLTVRGTVGIEAAVFGIPVLTAGTGRYDHKGFTIDSETREAYLARIAEIQDIPPLSPDQRELAERFAYGVFMLRPLYLTTLTLEYQKNAEATSRTRINATSKKDLLNAHDLRAFAQWVSDSNQLDFLMPSHGDKVMPGILRRASSC